MGYWIRSRYVWCMRMVRLVCTLEKRGETCCRLKVIEEYRQIPRLRRMSPLLNARDVKIAKKNWLHLVV